MKKLKTENPCLCGELNNTTNLTEGGAEHVRVDIDDYIFGALLMLFIFIVVCLNYFDFLFNGRNTLIIMFVLT